MTSDELKELERLRERAKMQMLPDSEEAVLDTSEYRDPLHREAYIAAMHNALPSLIAAVRERDELREWRKAAVRVLEYVADNELGIDYWTPVARKLIAQAEREGGERPTCLFCSKPLFKYGCLTPKCEQAAICPICDGGPGNHGSCLCGLTDLQAEREGGKCN